jgi:signal transduction histidine kinase
VPHTEEGPAEREVDRLGHRCAVVVRVAVAAVVGAFLVFTDAWYVAVALNLWSLVRAGVVADAVVVCVACLAQRWTVPADALHGATSWVMVVASVAVMTWQWQSGPRVRIGATAAVVAAYLAGGGVSTASVPVAAWFCVAALLSWTLFHLVRRGAREADRIMAETEEARRTAAVAAARRADERARLAALHDTAAALTLAIGAGSVTGREPWFADEVAAALAEVTGADPAPRGAVDLVPLLSDVVRRGPVAARFSATGPAPVAATAAAAICRSVGEALRNVARHAGVPHATVLAAYGDGRVVVEVVDDGRGFDPGAVPAHRHGIALSLVDRMAAVGGRAAVTARPGQGTRVRLEWPDG